MTVRECIRANPELTNTEIAKLCGTSAKVVGNKRVFEKRAKELAESQPALAAECEAVGIDLASVNHGWYKGKHWSLHFGSESSLTYENICDAIAQRMQAHSPIYTTFEYKDLLDPHLFVYDPADVHFNKLAMAIETGEDYNSQIAVIRMREGLNGLISKARGFEIDKILIIMGNDILNADGPSNSTTKGTHQDTDTMWFNAFQMAFDILVEQIESLTQIAPVVVKFNPSNHDVMSGFFLAHSLQCQFRNNTNVSFDCSISHRKYFRYGKNLIGTTHGDAAKKQDLPMLMAHETGVDWGQCKHKYFYTHHIHHKESKDYMSVCVESLRSPSSADGWHARNGYKFAPKAIEGFIHHPEFGQVARLTHIF